jgi:hypothetical protein
VDKKDEQDDFQMKDQSDDSLQSNSSYEANKISRRTALKRIGLTVGGLLLGFNLLDNPSKARASMEDLDDPAAATETPSSSSSSSSISSYYYASVCSAS